MTEIKYLNFTQQLIYSFIFFLETIDILGVSKRNPDEVPNVKI